MKLKYKIEFHNNKYYIFGYDKLGNKYDTMWSSKDKVWAEDMIKRIKENQK